MQDPFEPLSPKLAKRITERVSGQGISFSPLKTVVALIVLLLILPIGMAFGNLAGGAVYWAENEKRKYHEETDETR